MVSCLASYEASHGQAGRHAHPWHYRNAYGEMRTAQPRRTRTPLGGICSGPTHVPASTGALTLRTVLSRPVL